MKSSRIVERGSPLSQSFIWNLQARFYESLGIEAWLSGVIPSKITTNSFIARTYARMIAAYASETETSELTIVELGAGHGRFGFLCVIHLLEAAEQGLLPRTGWKYVLTDVAERNIEFWTRHEALRPLVERGVLDFARFEAGVDTELSLRACGRKIGIDHPVENLAVVGNYFFDSLPIDVWRTVDGKLHECLPVLRLNPEAPCCDPRDAAILEHLDLDWECEPRTSAGYSRTELNDLVEHFRRSLGDGAFTLPIGAFGLLEVLERWSNGGLALLSADKGYTREHDLIGRPLPTMVQHGCFSFSVNFCALAKWFEARGGNAWLPDFRDGNLEFAAFRLGAKTDSRGSFDRAYREGPAEFGPGDFHQVVRRCERTSPDLRSCLALIRLSGHEPQVFYNLRRAIRAQLDSACDADRDAVRETLEKVSKRFFHLDDVDVPFALGLVYQQLGEYEHAVRNYRRSLALFGDDATALHNLALCYVALDDHEAARACAASAVASDPEYDEARDLAARLEASVSAATHAVPEPLA